MPIDRGDRYRGVVDDPVHDHLRHVLLHRDLVGGDGGDLPRKLILARQIGLRRVNRDVVQYHAHPPVGVRVVQSNV